MNIVCQTSLGGTRIDAQRVAPAAVKHIAPTKKMMLDIRFRVCKSAWMDMQSGMQQRCSCKTKTLRQSCGKVSQSYGNLYCKETSSSPTSISGRRFSSSCIRAQMPGDLSLLSAETVREVIQEESILKQGGGVLELMDDDDVEIENEDEDDGVVLGYGWKVRDASRFDVEELRAVAHVQASSFHLQTAVFDDLFFKLFKAEVLSALIYKARQSPPDRYACLMAEPARELNQEMLDGEPNLTVIGAVNLTAMVDNEVLRHLHTATEYLYVSGMAVDVNYRRQNVATLLLEACDLRAIKWGFDFLALHAYEDDVAARTLYSRAGYKVIALDPLWMSSWVGRKRRVLMAKKTGSEIEPSF